MRLKLEKIRDLEDAELHFPPGLTLLAGSNQAGKTTILTCLAALLSGERAPITGVIKTDSALMVKNVTTYDPMGKILRRDVGKGAKASLIFDDGPNAGKWRAIEWKPPTANDSGSMQTAMSLTSTGLRPFSSMTPVERYDLLSHLLPDKPTIAELEKVCPLATPAALAEVRKFVEAGLWQEAFGHADDETKRFQGEWRAATARPWSEKTVDDYVPDHMPADRSLWSDEHISKIRTEGLALKKELENAPLPISESALTELREEASKVEAAALSLKTMQDELEKADTARQNAQLALSKLSAPGRPPPTADCPGCGITLEIVDGTTLRDVGNLPTDAEMSKAKRVYDTAKDEEKQAVLAYTSVFRQVQAAQSYHGKVRAAATRLEGLDPRVLDPSTDDAMEKRQRLADVMAEGQAVARYLTAIKARNSARMWAEIRDQCKPSGLRGTVLKRQLDAFNQYLFDLGAPLPGFVVALDENVNITCNGIPMQALSGAERWLADSEIQLSLAQLERAEIVLLDNADTLVEQNRGLLFVSILAEEAKHRRVIVAGASSADMTPDLAAHGWGQTLWVEAGTVRPFRESDDAAAA